MSGKVGVLTPLLLIPTNEHNLEARLGYPLTFVGWGTVGRSD